MHKYYIKVCTKLSNVKVTYDVVIPLHKL